MKEVGYLGMENEITPGQKVPNIREFLNVLKDNVSNLKRVSYCSEILMGKLTGKEIRNAETQPSKAPADDYNTAISMVDMIKDICTDICKIGDEINTNIHRAIDIIG